MYRPPPSKPALPSGRNPARVYPSGRTHSNLGHETFIRECNKLVHEGIPSIFSPQSHEPFDRLSVSDTQWKPVLPVDGSQKVALWARLQKMVGRDGIPITMRSAETTAHLVAMANRGSEEPARTQGITFMFTRGTSQPVELVPECMRLACEIIVKHSIDPGGPNISVTSKEGHQVGELSGFPLVLLARLPMHAQSPIKINMTAGETSRFLYRLAHNVPEPGEQLWAMHNGVSFRFLFTGLHGVQEYEKLG
jgi:hypothetical protein